jgi:cation diffusion facilitator family transporter
MAMTTDVQATRRSVLASMAVNSAETIALAVAAWVSGSVALRAQTAANFADLAVEVFLLIGVLSSARAPDETHPLGYGRERFFWSLLAALGIFVGGGGLALEGALRSALHPSPVGSYPIAYLVLATTLVLDAFVLMIALRPVRRQAAELGMSLPIYMRRSTDPAATTVVVAGGCAVIGCVIAVAGLSVSQITRSVTPDTVAGALIGLLLLVASVFLLRANRALLTGRGVPVHMVGEMRRIVSAQQGVVDVPDLFAIVVGPSSLIVDGDITFADDMDVPAVEQAIMRSAAALRERWPSIDYVYLTPVAKPRSRRPARSMAVAAGGTAALQPAAPQRSHDDSLAGVARTERTHRRSSQQGDPVFPGACAARESWRAWGFATVALLAVISVTLPEAAGEAAPGHGVIFSETFSESVPAKIQFDRAGVWSVHDGHLRAVLPNGKQERSFAYFGSKDWANYSVDVDLCGLHGVDKGVAVRVEGRKAVIVDLRGPGYGDIVMYRGFTKLCHHALANPNGAWNHLRIEVQGPRYRVFVNGRLTVDFCERHNKRPRGRIALVAYTGGSGQCDVLYDNVVVRALP